MMIHFAGPSPSSSQYSKNSEKDRTEEEEKYMRIQDVTQKSALTITDLSIFCTRIVVLFSFDSFYECTVLLPVACSQEHVLLRDRPLSNYMHAYIPIPERG